MDLFGLKAKKNARMYAKEELQKMIVSQLNKGMYNDSDYTKFIEYATSNSLKESDVKEIITESVTQILIQKAKDAFRDFELSETEYANLFDIARKADISKAQFDKIIANEQVECLYRYIKLAMKDGKLSSDEKRKIEELARKANISEKKYIQAINKAKADFIKAKNERYKELVSCFKQYLIIGGISAVVLSGLIGGGFAVYHSKYTPKIPKEISVAPNPLFEVGDYLSGEITGIFKQHSIPKNCKLIITPYIDCKGARYYGNPEIYVGERVMEEGYLVEYDKELPIKLKFHIMNPTYGKTCNLCIHFDAFRDNDNIMSKDKKIANVWSLESLNDDKEKRESTPTVLITIFGILLVVSIVGIYMAFAHWYSTIVQFVFIILFILSLLLIIIPGVRISHIETEFEELRHQYEKTIRVNQLQNGENIKDDKVNTINYEEVE